MMTVECNRNCPLIKPGMVHSTFICCPYRQRLCGQWEPRASTHAPAAQFGKRPPTRPANCTPARSHQSKSKPVAPSRNDEAQGVELTIASRCSRLSPSHLPIQYRRRSHVGRQRQNTFR